MSEVKLLPISNIGTSGINSDLKSWELPPEFLTDGRNFRVTENSIRTVGGHKVWASDVDLFNPGHILNIPNQSGNYWILAGRNKVKVFDGAVFTDISSTVGYSGLGAGDERLWTSCMIGNIPVISNPQAQPEYWSPQTPGQIMQPLMYDATNTFADVGKSFNIIRSHKNYLFALDLTEGAVELPNSYRWSHPADINGLPFSWDPSDPSSLASIEQIGGDSGRIIDGLTMRDSFVIYTENGVHVLDPTYDETSFRRRAVSSTFGLLSKDCIAEVRGDHFFIADGDIVRNNGSKLDSIIHKRLRRNLLSRMSVDGFTNSFVVKNTAEKELWFCIPEEQSLTPNIAFVYNWRDDSWAIRDLPTSLYFASYGIKTEPTITWETWSENWNTTLNTWGSRRTTPLSNTVIGIDSTTSDLLVLDLQDNTENFNTIFERVGLPVEGQTSVTTINKVFPYVDGIGDMIFQFGSQDFVGSPIRWKPEIRFNPVTDRKIDVRTTGELHCWRVKSINNNYFEMSGMDIQYVKNGER